MNEIVLLTRTGKQFFTYLKSDTKKIEAAINAGFRVATKDETEHYLEKLGLTLVEYGWDQFSNEVGNYVKSETNTIKPETEIEPKPKPEPKAKTDQKPETPKATVEPTETQKSNN